MNINLADEKIHQLLNYLAEFDKWNKAYNLSAIRDPQEMVTKHLLDSLVLMPFFAEAMKQQQHRIIDVGTGGGLPGIPMAIVFSDLPITLLDSNGKKTRFLFQIKTALGLKNIAIENTRVETFQAQKKFTIIVSRAFSSLESMVSGTEHLLEPGGAFWAMKGLYPENELREIQKHVIVDTCHKLTVPELEGERHLLKLTLSTQ